MTNMGASAEGAEMITFLAPPLMCAWAVASVVNTPVHRALYRILITSAQLHYFLISST